jgi:mannose-6-phosphate isomerase
VKPGVLMMDPHLKEVIWGSRRLQEAFGKVFPADRLLGESWEISCVSGGESRIRGRGRPLVEAFREDPEWFVGPERAREPFPLLVKLLATSDLLSLQVHPDDSQARKLGDPPPGKHEAWWILEAEPGARIFLGLREGVTTEALGQAILDGGSDRVIPLLREVRVAPGQVFDIRPGTLHAIGQGITLLEIQQPSDLTYRVFDWDRVGADGKPRPLHVDKALSVIDQDARPEPSPSHPMAGIDGDLLLHTPRFRLERWRVDGLLEVPVTELICLVCVDGEGSISSPPAAPYRLTKGASCVIPRGVNMARLEGRLDIAVCLPPV